MQRVGSKRVFIVLMLIALILALAVPVVSFGKDKGRRGGRGRNLDNWKCGRFVTCHDARDGRLDNRGRRRNTFSGWDWRNNRDDRWDNRWWDGRSGNAGWWDQSDRRRWNRWDSSRRWSSRSDEWRDNWRYSRWRQY